MHLGARLLNMKNFLAPAARTAALLTLLLLNLANASTLEPEPPANGVIVLAIPAHAKVHVKNGDPSSTAASLRLSKAFAALGYRLEFAFFPSSRALAQANSGNVDGVFTLPQRAHYEQSNLLPVETPTTQIAVGLYTLLDNSETTRWPDRELGSVASVLGMDLPDNFQLQKSIVQPSKSAQHSLKLLQSQRVDAILIADMTLQALRNLEPELAQNIIELTPKMSPLNLHTFLHKRHQALLPALSEQLRLQHIAVPLGN